MSIYESAVSGASEIERSNLKSENHGTHIYIKDKAEKLIFLQETDVPFMPQEILDLQTTDPQAFLYERVQRCALALGILSFGFDWNVVKAHNDKEKAKSEKDETYTPNYIRGIHNYVVNFNKDNAHEFAKKDPIAWLWANRDELVAKMPFELTAMGKMKIARRIFMVVMDMTGAERLFEMNTSQFNRLKESFDSFEKYSKRKSREFVWEVSKRDAGKTTAYYGADATEIEITDDSEIDFEVPEKPTLNFDDGYMFGVPVHETRTRRAALVSLGLEPYFPKDADWYELPEEIS